MSNVLVFGDGPLAYEIASLAKKHNHSVLSFLLNETGEKPPKGPFFELSSFLENASNVDIDLAVEANVSGLWPIKRRPFQDIIFRFHEIPILTASLNASTSEVGEWVSHAKIQKNIIGWATIPPLEKTGVIELLPGLETSEVAIEAAQQFFTSLGKEPIIIKDCVGGVLPRVVASLINNAAYALMEGVASAADIDAAMKLGTNYPFGPLEWADKIGLDQVLGILEALCETHGQERYRPAPILRQLVYAGHWGKRTGRGFYEYP